MPNRIKIVLADDKSHAMMEFVNQPDDTAALRLNEEQLLLLIRSLGQVHQDMVRGREPPPLAGERIDLVTDTRWAVSSEQLGEATVMSFQHPAYGPVSFMIPLDQAERIAERMLLQVRTAREARVLAN